MQVGPAGRPGQKSNDEEAEADTFGLSHVRCCLMPPHMTTKLKLRENKDRGDRKPGATFSQFPHRLCSKYGASQQRHSSDGQLPVLGVLQGNGSIGGGS